MYRADAAENTPRSLPWSRRRINEWSGALAVVAMLAIVLPQLAFLTVIGSPLGRGFGFGALFLIVLSFAVPLAMAAAGGALLRGRKLVIGLLFAIGLFPFAASMLISAHDHHTAGLVLAYDDVRTIGQTAASFIATAEYGAFFGACSSAASCAVLATALAATLATVDRDRIAAKPGNVWSIFVAGGAWFAAAFAVRVVFHDAFQSSALLAVSLSVPLAATILAGIATWCSGVIAHTEDPKERRGAFACVSVGALAAAAFVLLVDLGSSSGAKITTLQQIAAVDVPPAERFTRVAWLVDALRAHVVVALVDLGGAIAVGAAAILAAWRAAKPEDRRGMLRSRGLAAGVASVLLALALAGAHAIVASMAREAISARVRTATPALPKDLEPPVVARSAPHRIVPPPATNAVTQAGDVLAFEGEVEPAGVGLPVLVPDRRTTFATFANLALSNNFRTPGRSFVLLADVEGERDLDRSELGNFAIFVGSMQWACETAVVDYSPLSFLTVTLDEAPLAKVQFAGEETIVSIGGDEDPAERNAALKGQAIIDLAPRPNDTMGRVVAVFAALEQVGRVRLRFTRPQPVRFPPRRR